MSVLAADDLSRDAYEVVNGKPQATITEDGFSVYWALWRRILPEERSATSIISERRSSWMVRQCDGAPVTSDGETMYFYDRLMFDDNGVLEPLPFAVRRGYRYFSILNFNSRFAKNRMPFVVPERLAGESAARYRHRKGAAFAEWVKGAAVLETQGEATVSAVHRLFDENPAEGDFWDDPRLQRPELAAWAPDRWPFYFDERAHKPFHIKSPELWSKPFLRQTKIGITVKWYWCDGRRDLWVELPEASNFAPGPTRDGRPDSGTANVPIIIRNDGL